MKKREGSREEKKNRVNLRIFSCKSPKGYGNGITRMYATDAKCHGVKMKERIKILLINNNE